MARLRESPIPPRASVPPANATRRHHGQGFGSGHPWTTLGLISHDRLMPLPPRPDASKREGLAPHRDDRPEPELVVDDLSPCNLEDASGADEPYEVSVFADRGADAHPIEPAMANQRWHFLIAFSKTRRLTSDTRALTTPPSPPGCQMALGCRHHRRLQGYTRRLMTPGIAPTTHQRLSARRRERARGGLGSQHTTAWAPAVRRLSCGPSDGTPTRVGGSSALGRGAVASRRQDAPGL